MTGITWPDVLGAFVLGVAWWVGLRLRRLDRARAAEAERREAYRRCMTEEEERQAAEFAAETLVVDEAEMVALVAWYRMTEGTGE